MDKWPEGDQIFNDIQEYNFTLKTFKPLPALKSLKPINGYFHTELYRGQQYNKIDYTLVPNAWDHEHCRFCSFRIENGINYWGNTNDIVIMCTKCHEYFKNQIDDRNNIK